MATPAIQGHSGARDQRQVVTDGIDTAAGTGPESRRSRRSAQRGAPTQCWSQLVPGEKQPVISETTRANISAERDADHALNVTQQARQQQAITVSRQPADTIRWLNAAAESGR
ncbi:hypothetical protein MJ584_14080 [Klebsiella pneumoniae]|nr:hypothetical protein MJ584_14080 [Klebsiella pneumoniae]